MITLILLHPFQYVPAQSWSFEQESVVRIGRSTDNHVVLYSAVVSRYHVELRRQNTTWEIVNLGTNGTYLEGKPITQVPVVDGVIIHLARSGPKIQIRLGKKALEELKAISAEETMAQQVKDASVPVEAVPEEVTLVPAHQQQKEMPPKTETFSHLN
ncbi:FHA domain-containing protein [Microcoleus sp. FACHB-68]|uniref:FHA domain-containing protein n=1 Tax=Microcoleus sp. FACHB-68 TaxID=2692826 RepID=UPI0016864447|nr:FHA domain-containing protein [Microcoleus sp. FACHB-68]